MFTFIQKLFAARTRTTPTRRTRLGVDRLETRAVPAALAMPWAGTLYVMGTDQADEIGITSSGDVVRVRVETAGEAPQVFTFPRSGISQIAAWGYGGDDSIVNATALKSAIEGGEGYDQLVGGLGNDTINGGDGDDVVWGSSGNDRIDGGNGNDILIGGNHDDTITGGAGRDELYGDAGHDRLNGGDGNDILSGGSGDDYLDGWRGFDALFGDDGDDTLVVHEVKLFPLPNGLSAYLPVSEYIDWVDGGDGLDTYIFSADLKLTA